MLVQNSERKGDGICFGTKLSTPPLPILQLLYISTGEPIKSIASGRTVTSDKAHNRDPISTCFFSFADKVPKSFLHQEPPPHYQHGTGHSPAPKNGQSSTPAAEPQQQADNKVYAFKKELETFKVSFCLTTKSVNQESPNSHHQ